MKAVTFDVTVPRYILARALGGFTESVLWGGPSGVRLTEVDLPDLPGDRWVELEVILAGICGTDLGNLSFGASPAMEPFGSFPAVLGHEILARVVRCGPAVRGVEGGQRVVVDPMLSCTTRGWDDRCDSCSEGAHATCGRAGEEGALRIDGEPLAPGLTVGYHRHLPGGWGERMIAHESQLFAVPDEIDDRTAVLTEPLAIGMRAAVRSLSSRSTPPAETAGEHRVVDGPILVIGSGPIAFATLWSLRALGYRGELIAQTKRRHEADLAVRLGASSVVKPGLDARQALIDTGARAYQPIVGDEVYNDGGFSLIFDCVGSRSSLEQSLRFATPRGRVVMLGCAAQVSKIDLTWIWAREVELKGFVGYGEERWRGRTLHTFELTLERMAETGQELSAMVTHVFPLSGYREALHAAANRRESGAVKVVLEPGGR